MRGVRSRVFLVALAAVYAVEAVGCGGSNGPLATTAVSESVATSSSGLPFADPQGTYTIAINRDWTDESGLVVAEIEAWRVAPPIDGFAPNVNVLTQVATGMDLGQYICSAAR